MQQLQVGRTVRERMTQQHRGAGRQTPANRSHLTPVDPLEDVLRLLRPKGGISARLVAGGDWAVRFDAPPHVKFNAVTQGSCLLTVDGIDRPVTVEEGDCYLLTRPHPYVLSSGQGVDPVDADAVFTQPTPTAAFAQVGSRRDCTIVGGAFSFLGRSRSLLLDQLPPLIHVPATSEHSVGINEALAWISREAHRGELGRGLVVNHLAVLMLVHVLRHHVRTDRHKDGWLAGSADPVVGPVLRALHGNPAHPWTIREVAATAGVSRSTLAARFKNVVGTSPLDYLTAWRIELASNHLVEGRDTVSAIASAVGYSSESTLSIAFKRIVGLSPGAYRKIYTATST
ncbi:AraC family transcriptional regulator [Streptomyces sp. NPDC048409]|uniref:AraC family transcriptional regulator n=1 Tax=Streptomyces sp. NPDC048409 TaxID=3154723 RepID=UPI00341C12E3